MRSEQKNPAEGKVQTGAMKPVLQGFLNLSTMVIPHVWTFARCLGVNQCVCFCIVCLLRIMSASVCCSKPKDKSLVR